MFQLEVVVMFICLWSKSNFFDNHFSRICLLLFFLTLLLVQKFLIVQNAAYWRRCIRRNLYKVKIHIICYTHSLLKGIHSLLYIVAHQANFTHPTNLVIDSIREFFFYSATTLLAILRICYSFILLKVSYKNALTDDLSHIFETISRAFSSPTSHR